MPILKLSISNNRIILRSDSGRVSAPIYKALRKDGWLYSHNLQAFCFAFGDSGAERVSRFEEKPYKIRSYVSNDSEKQEILNEMQDLNIVYESDEFAEKIRNLNDARLKKISDEKQEKQEKEKQADENRAIRWEKMKNQLSQLKNGFGASLYDASFSNYNMSDLLARSGVRVCYRVAELAEEFGFIDSDKLISEEDIIQISIRYGNNWTWSAVSSRYLSIEVDHFTSSKEGWMSGGSDHYQMEKVLLDKEARINFKNVVKVSELFDETTLKKIFNSYIDYKSGKIDYISGINSIGAISGHEVSSAPLDEIKNKFLESIGGASN